jgi:hypothetical protein
MIHLVSEIKKNQQHIVKIFYMWMFCITLKERNTKRFVQNWHSPSHPRQNGHDANHYATDVVPYLYFLFIIFLIKISYCPSIYYLNTKINPKQ